MLAQELRVRYRGPGWGSWSEAPWREGSRRGLRGSCLPHSVDQDSGPCPPGARCAPGREGAMSTPPPFRVAPPPSLLGPEALWGLNKVLPAREYSEICSFQTVFVNFMARESPPRSFETGVTLPVSQVGIIGLSRSRG